MKKTRKNDYRPDLEILGMTWTPGDLVLVGSRPGGCKFQYVLGNGVVHGTKEEIPVALFTTEVDREWIMRTLIRMQVGDEVYDNGQYSAKDYKDYPIYIDNTTHLTIAYLVNRIFHMVDENGVQMVIVDRLQNVDGSRLAAFFSKERELNAVLRILKALAESMSIVIVVISELSDNVFKSGKLPTIRDILDVSEAEEHCDQIVLIQPLYDRHNQYKMILPLGHRYNDNKYEGLVLNVTMDRDKHYFQKATELFDEESYTAEETPMYKWYSSDIGEWNFGFIDSEGMGWTLNVEPMPDNDVHFYQIRVYNWPGEEELLDDYVDLDDIELIKAIALEKARKFFPEVEIPDRTTQ